MTVCDPLNLPIPGVDSAAPEIGAGLTAIAEDGDDMSVGTESNDSSIGIAHQHDVSGRVEGKLIRVRA